ncbi:MAG: sugar phosphate nucleotidyltransferase [Bdellovibrionota bacterium]
MKTSNTHSNSTSIENVPLLILAGGKATRLKDLSVNTPKYLMPITDPKSLDKEKVQTFADFHLKWAYEQGFRRIFLSVGHLAEAIKEYCKDGSKWSLNISYLDDGSSPKGTGGAIALSLSHNFDYLAITYGDTMLTLNAGELFDHLLTTQNRNQNIKGLMTIYPLNIEGHIANASYDNGLARYSKKEPNPDWKHIDYGFLFLQRDLVEGLPSSRPLDLAEPLADFCSKNKILAHICKERFWEIGSLESLQEFQNRFSNKT